jgi:hypothetical protein
VLQVLITIAQAEAEESSKTAYYVAGIVLALFAVVISAIGIRSHETFPPTRAGSRAVIGLAVILVAATMTAAILTS